MKRSRSSEKTKTKKSKVNKVEFEEIIHTAIEKGDRDIIFDDAKYYQKLKNNKEYFTKLIKADPVNLFYAGDDLKNDKEFISWVATFGDSKSMQYISEILKSDPDIAFIAGKYNEFSLQNFSNELIQNRDFGLKMVYANPHTIQFFNEKFRSDKEIMLNTLVKHVGLIENYRGNVWPGKLFMQYVDRELLEDKTFIIRAIKAENKLIDMIPKKYKNDKEINLAMEKRDNFSKERLEKLHNITFYFYK